MLLVRLRHVIRYCVSDSGKSYKYVCMATNQPDTKSNPNPNPNPNPSTTKHAVVNI